MIKVTMTDGSKFTIAERADAWTTSGLPTTPLAVLSRDDGQPPNVHGHWINPAQIVSWEGVPD